MLYLSLLIQEFTHVKITKVKILGQFDTSLYGNINKYICYQSNTIVSSSTFVDIDISSKWEKIQLPLFHHWIVYMSTIQPVWCVSFVLVCLALLILSWQLHLSLSLASGEEASDKGEEMIAIHSLNLLLKSIGATLTDVDDLIFK